MKVNRRRLARGIALVGAILALGFLVGFSSIYLGQLFSGSSSPGSPNPDLEGRRASPTGLTIEQAASLLDQLGELLKRCDAILRDRVSPFDIQRLEGLRSQLYQIHLDLTKLLLKGS